MQSTSKFASVLSVALAFGLVQVLGCAAPAEPEGASPTAAAEAVAVDQPADVPAMAADEIEAALADADALFQSEQFEPARVLYAALAAQQDALSNEQAELVETRIGRIDSILHEASLAAGEPTAEEEAVAEPEPEPVDADELLAVVEELCAERELIQAAGHFETLDEMRGMLTPARKLDYDQLRMDFQAETGQLPVLTEDEKEERAEQHLDYGVEAYEEGRLRNAQQHLLTARAFDVSIGWLDNRKLRRTLERVNDRILQAQDEYVAARHAFEYGDADEAEALLAALAEDPAGLDEEQLASLDHMLKAIRTEKAEAAAAVAADALAQARMAVEDEDYQAAEAALAEAEPVKDMLSADQLAELNAVREEIDAAVAEAAAAAAAAAAPAPEEAIAEPAEPIEEEIVEEAVEPVAEEIVEAAPAEEAAMAEEVVEEVVPEQEVEEAMAEEAVEEVAVEEPAEEMVPEEAVEELAAEEEPAEEEDPADVAQALFDEGIEAYEDGRYAEALLKLDQAAALDVSIGWLDNRKLRKVRAELSELVPEMLADYEQAAEHFEAGDYELVVATLQPVVERGVNFGDPQTAEAAELLAAARQKLVETEAQELQMRMDRAAEMLASARELAGRGDYVAAQQALTDLAEYDDVLTDRQREAIATMTEQVAGAADVVTVEKKLAEAEMLAAEAEKLLKVQRDVQAKLREADAAAGREDYVTAEARLSEAEEMLADVDVTASPALAAARDDVAARMQSVSAAAAEQARVQDVRRRIDALLDDATQIAQTDLLAAEEKVLEARRMAENEDVDMTVVQLERSNAVLAMVEAEYGVERRLRPATYAQLPGLATALMAEGEPAKAVQVIELVKDAPEKMVGEAVRMWAADMLSAAEQASRAQQEVAGTCQAMLAEAQADLERGELADALNRSDAAVSKAREADLSGAALLGVLKSAASFLEEDFARAVAEARPEEREVIDQLVGRARAAQAFNASRFYLNNGSPALARPYLNVLLESDYATQDVRAAAREAMDSMPALEAQAERELLLAVKAEADAVHDLATRLNEAVKAGDLNRATQLEVALADAKVALAAARAEALISRGAYSAAAEAVGNAPTATASEAAEAMHLDPLRHRLDSLRKMATNLLAAEKSLQAYNVNAAQAKLTAAASTAAESELLSMKLEVLAEAVDQVRAAQEEHVALTVRRDGQLETVRNMLAVATAQQDVWQSFFDALSSFLAGEEGGTEAVQEVAADPSGLPAAAAALAAELAGDLAEWQARPAADEAGRVLAAARASYAAADYVTAAALLDQMRGMPGASDPVLRAQADELGERIDRVEEMAAALYAQAVAGHAEQDAERVRAALTELKSKYANTKTYREHM